ncbi:hypothetical protein [Gracilimonas amylolytica]|uniref:hypothetical protein n=1 Tax=Gracilimonas amylolytica TaxID=1749045 RepID=UPI000CD8D487|nr:hypothetical protein [Gracilimonas amylolytica]
MKTLILSILTFLAAGLTFQANAQVTAVMQARVEVISGAGFTALNEQLIDFTSVNAFEDFEAGTFTLVTTPGSEINVRLENKDQVVNEQGEILDFDTLQAEQVISPNGEHDISINGKVSDLQQLNGHYQGAITAVVEYY